MDTAITTVALVDDHKLFRSGIKQLLSTFSGYKVICEADNGEEFCRLVKSGNVPDIALVDLHMPKMDGTATTSWLKKHYPGIKIIILSMAHDEGTILRLLHAGVKGYLVKEADPGDFRTALNMVRHDDLYYPAYVSQYVVKRSIDNIPDPNLNLKVREIEFLSLIASDLTYKEIANKMKLSARTVDGYREQLFSRFNVKSRVGLAIYAVKNNLIRLS